MRRSSDIIKCLGGCSLHVKGSEQGGWRLERKVWGRRVGGLAGRTIPVAGSRDDGLSVTVGRNGLSITTLAHLDVG